MIKKPTNQPKKPLNFSENANQTQRKSHLQSQSIFFYKMKRKKTPLWNLSYRMESVNTNENIFHKQKVADQWHSLYIAIFQWFSLSTFKLAIKKIKINKVLNYFFLNIGIVIEKGKNGDENKLFHNEFHTGL